MLRIVIEISGESPETACGSHALPNSLLKNLGKGITPKVLTLCLALDLILKMSAWSKIKSKSFAPAKCVPEFLIASYAI